MSSKKICYITTVPITIDSFILKSIEYLHENTEWDISVICDNDRDFAKRLPEYVHYFPVSMERGISISGIKAMIEMVKIFKKERFDLIQYSTPNASLYASLAGKLVGVPVRLYCQWGMAFIGFKGIKKAIFKQIEKIVCKLSTWIEPDSYSNLKFAHKQKLYPSNKGSVIWNGSACGIDLNKFAVNRKVEYRRNIRSKLKIPDEAFVFGFVGRVTRDKGINELFSAAQNIIENNPNVYLLMVGGEELDNTVDASLYEWTKENDHVIYVGYTRQVEQYLSAMDCYVLPSYREGFGMSVIEAEAMELPVIVTDIPGPIDAMKENETGLIVKKADVYSLQNAMLYMINHEKEAIRFGKSGKNYVVNNFEQKALFQYILEDRERLIQESRGC